MVFPDTTIVTLGLGAGLILAITVLLSHIKGIKKKMRMFVLRFDSIQGMVD
jgi:hypothetical protein